ncbi:hypothetical protein OG585_50040 (plasmid) [Streptomyces sp. NBC_01340]|uniref:DUF6924 domain-containing protein n=1 Tax=unclassified Streptomyces TaxID=2593676 RepID=UPI002255B067|nr:MULTISPECIES: hypothetical protein [unclassified Streptomyces]MCX4460723.1 hypothetical protein [Streptomyces sp. NBC_01719]MCX4499947.1 hypothetical protein [Streptomyces sp. NBC_01728]WSI45073.1 hypothetical protein OG585_50040 [Streptomyces sp. NBC_01340]
MVALSELSERNEFSAVIIRTDFTDETVWREVTAELAKSTEDDDVADDDDGAGNDFADHFLVLDAPELGDADTDTILAAIAAHETLGNELELVFVADSTTMRADHHALLAITTLTREDIDDDEAYEAMVEFGREFRTVPSGVHEIQVNVELANMDFEEFSASADADPEGVFRSFLLEDS